MVKFVFFFIFPCYDEDECMEMEGLYDTRAYYKLVDCDHIVFDRCVVAAVWICESENGANGAAIVLYHYDHNGCAFIT